MCVSRACVSSVLYTAVSLLLLRIWVSPQVQPQLLSQLSEQLGSSDPAAVAALERLSFGLIAVYTCSAHCSAVSPQLSPQLSPYREEFVYVQPDPFYG